jgi:HEXXH motif-containing protein
VSEAATTAHAVTDPGFYPDPARGRIVDQGVRQALATSLDAILHAAEGDLPIDRAATEALLVALRGHRMPPGIMALYGDLVTAIFDDDRDSAEAILGVLGDPRLSAEPNGLRSVTLDSDALPQLVADSYRHHFLDGSDLTLDLLPLSTDALADATARFEAGRSLLRRSHPALAAEIDTLVTEVVFVLPEGDTKDLTLHGASTFFAWGALMLNPEPHDDRLKMAEVLVHETAHSLLHGLTLGKRMVENPDTERFPSPLRYDARPMEGLAHASYVLARMHLGMTAILASGLLNDAERIDALAAIDRSRRNFEDGYSVVRAHARFTPRGAEIFAGAVAYMAMETLPD